MTNVKTWIFQGTRRVLFVSNRVLKCSKIYAMGILEYSENIKQLTYKLPYHLHEISF